jgi:hypothetical protein
VGDAASSCTKNDGSSALSAVSQITCNESSHIASAADVHDEQATNTAAGRDTSLVDAQDTPAEWQEGIPEEGDGLHRFLLLSMSWSDTLDMRTQLPDVGAAPLPAPVDHAAACIRSVRTSMPQGEFQGKAFVLVDATEQCAYWAVKGVDFVGIPSLPSAHGVIVILSAARFGGGDVTAVERMLKWLHCVWYHRQINFLVPHVPEEGWESFCISMQKHFGIRNRQLCSITQFPVSQDLAPCMEDLLRNETPMRMTFAAMT